MVSHLLIMMICTAYTLRIFRLYFCYACAKEQMSMHKHHKGIGSAGGDGNGLLDNLLSMAARGASQNDTTQSHEFSHWFTQNKRFVSTKYLVGALGGLTVFMGSLLSVIFGTLYRRQALVPEDEDCLPIRVSLWTTAAYFGTSKTVRSIKFWPSRDCPSPSLRADLFLQPRRNKPDQVLIEKDQNLRI